ncbi:MAG: hypothetical protein HY541_08315 [Deltaproteobacteria bacterium]|nr:hypothetical protein [Deltaproteobacteria bacterium]
MGVKKLLSKPPPAERGQVNYHFVDRFTLVHLAIGLGYGWVGFGFWSVLLLALAWEFIENPLKVHFPFVFPHATADTWQNMAGDSLAVVLGWQMSGYII